MSTRRITGQRVTGTAWAIIGLFLILMGVFGSGDIVGSVGLAHAQQREMQLSLREATAFALQNNLDIQIAGLSPRIQEAQVTEQKGIFDVEGQASVQVSDARLLSTSSLFREEVANELVAQDDSQEQQGSLGISQLTPWGGRYEVEFSATHLETTRATSATAETEIIRTNERPPLPDELAPRNEFFTAEIGLSVTQPLLRNFGSQVTKNQILIAQNNLSISQEEFRQQVIAVTSQVQQSYWALVFRRRDLEVRHQQRELAQRLLGQIRKQVAVGTLAPIEVLQAETEIARVDENILVAENALRTTEDQLKRIMNISLLGALADVVLLPADLPQYMPPNINQQEEIGQALAQRPDLIQAKLALENQHITLVFNKNQVLPTLDLEASLRFNGIDTGFGSSFGEFDLRRRYRWDVGVTFRYPLANRQAKSRLEQSRLAIRQQMIRIKNLEENIIVEVRNAVRDVLTNAQRVQAARVARRLAEKQLEGEQKRLQVGLSTVFTVLDFQSDLSVERSSEINVLTGYLQSLVRLEEVKSTLLEAYNIVLQSTGPRFQ